MLVKTAEIPPSSHPAPWTTVFLFVPKLNSSASVCLNPPRNISALKVSLIRKCLGGLSWRWPDLLLRRGPLACLGFFRVSLLRKWKPGCRRLDLWNSRNGSRVLVKWSFLKLHPKKQLQYFFRAVPNITASEKNALHSFPETFQGPSLFWNST